MAGLCTPSAPRAKRLRLGSPVYGNLSEARAQSVTIKARSTPFPWSTAVPENIAGWFESYAKSRNTRPEFIFAAAMTTVAALMGPRAFMKIREEYLERVNLYTIIMAEPGAGKSQAYSMGIVDPLKGMNEPMDNILIDEFTRKGLFKHLQRNSSAYLAYDELTQFFDVVQKRQYEGGAERQILCRLYDNGRWTSTVGT